MFCNRHPHEPVCWGAYRVMYFFCKFGCALHDAANTAGVIVDFQNAKRAEAPRQRDIVEPVKGAQLTVDLRCNSSERCLHATSASMALEEVGSRLS